MDRTFINADVPTIVDALSIDEKIQLLGGKDFWRQVVDLCEFTKRYSCQDMRRTSPRHPVVGSSLNDTRLRTVSSLRMDRTVHEESGSSK